ncbi:hypothetical protein EMIT053CA3_300005 [Pseudomonas donghuensis]
MRLKRLMSRALSEAVLAPVSSLAATSRSISARRAYSLRPYTVFSAAWPRAGNRQRLNNRGRGVSLINPGAVLCDVRVKATGSTAQASSFTCHLHKQMTDTLFVPRREARHSITLVCWRQRLHSDNNRDLEVRS